MQRLVALAAAGLFTLGLAASATQAEAGTYPTNKCVASKQKAAGKYCQSALKAWSKWESTQTKSDAIEKRDANLGKASNKLGSAWSKAEEKSAKKDVDCVATTTDAASVVSSVEGQVSALASIVDTGSDTGDTTDLKCRAKVLVQLGKLCGGLLKAQSKHITTTGRDPLRERLGALLDRSRERFTDKAGTAGACVGDSPLVELPALVTSADTLSDGIVISTVVAPSVALGEWTEIIPEEGGTEYLGRTLNTICSDSTPWKMWARRGTVNKLAVYFQGGGACWNNLTCGLGTCDPNVQDAADHPDNFEFGFANFENPDNPVGDWNAIFIPYCTCDIHWGNKRALYPGQFGLQTVEHRGRINASFAEKWVREHFVNPDQIVVTGSSAGGYGAFTNSVFLHEVYGSSRFAVIGDGSLGVVTSEFVAGDLNNWGLLGELPDHIPALNVNSLTGLDIADMISDIALYYEDRGSLFSQYSTRDDWNQAIFYNAQVRTAADPDFGNWKADVCDWHDQALALTQDIATRAPNNFRYYIGPG
ncbi:MAG: hypothetical protein ACI91F_003084, partial [Candidatus Binatia bacterium]